MQKKISKTISIILFVIGLFGLIGIFTYKYIGEKRNENLINSFELDKIIDNEGSKTEISNDSSSDEESLFKQSVMAIINIPKVDIRYPVVPGTDAETLRKSLGYFEGTGLPGEIGNFCVAGHRNSSYARYFNRLDEVNVGDEIIVETRNDEFTYIVTNTMKIHENQTSVLDTSNKKMITLITCTNGFKPKYRIVVQGELKSAEL